MDPFQNTWIPLDSWVTQGIDWVVLHFRPLFQGIRVPVDFILSGFQTLLLGMPAPVAILVFALIAWQFSTLSMGAATLISLIAIGAIGAWSQAMVTLALVLTSLFFCILIGLPSESGWRAAIMPPGLFGPYWMQCRPHPRSSIWSPSLCCSVSVTSPVSW